MTQRFTLNTTKHTTKSIKALDEDGFNITNLLNNSSDFDKCYIERIKKKSPVLGSSKLSHPFGKPAIIVREFESSPGAWVFDDTETDTKFVLWSDGWKKHPWKGSSIDVIIDPKCKDARTICLDFIDFLFETYDYWYKHTND